MPLLIHPSLVPSPGNTADSSSPLGHSHFACRLLVALILLAALFALHRYTKRPQQARSEGRPQQATHTAVSQQKLWLSEKSLGGLKYSPAMVTDKATRDLTTPATDSVPRGMPAGHGSAGEDSYEEHEFSAYMSGSAGGETTLRQKHTPRNPPAPPLTAPRPDDRIYNLQDRDRITKPSTSHQLDPSFFQQPNPDYSFSSGSAASGVDERSEDVNAPRRRSYTKLLSVRTAQTGPDAADDEHLQAQSPSSFTASEYDSYRERALQVEGEVISATDDTGAGWKRHTRVYGGGPCLACAASGSHHHGGFYGENVRPEERR